MIIASTTESPIQAERRLRADFLERLAAVPLSEWPQVLAHVLAVLASARPSAPAVPERERLLSPHVRHICLFIRAHPDEPISIERLAARVDRNAAYIATLFRRQTGTTIHRYLTRIRMRRAAAMLRRSEKVEAVALHVGYRSKKNFYQQFAAAFGVTPGQYKAGLGHARAVRPDPK